MREIEQVKRYVKYGVVKDEQEWIELKELTADVANAIWCDELSFDLNEERMINVNKLDMLNKFHIGFCEGCVFQNILIIMRLLHFKIEKKEIAKMLNISIDIVNDIEHEYSLRNV